MSTNVNARAKDRWERLLAEYSELRSALDELTAEGKRNFPGGFDGNGKPGDFESWEADWADADRDLRVWIASADGQEFKRLAVAELIDAVKAIRATRGGTMALGAQDPRTLRLWSALDRAEGL